MGISRFLYEGKRKFGFTSVAVSRMFVFVSNFESISLEIYDDCSFL